MRCLDTVLWVRNMIFYVNGVHCNLNLFEDSYLPFCISTEKHFDQLSNTYLQSVRDKIGSDSYLKILIILDTEICRFIYDLSPFFRISNLSRFPQTKLYYSAFPELTNSVSTLKSAALSIIFKFLKNKISLNIL